MHTFVVRRLRRHRALLLGCYDVATWVGCMVVFNYTRWAIADTGGFILHRALLAGLVAATLHVAIGYPLRLHHGRHPVGSLEELVQLGLVGGLTGFAVTTANSLAHHYLPITVPFVATFAALVLMAWPRMALRSLSERDGRRSGAHGAPVVVIGAGDAGAQLVGSMQRDPASRWHPVAVVDDDPFRRHRWLHGVTIQGTIDQLARVAAAHGAATAILAIPSADTEVVRRVTDLATGAGLTLKVLPTTAEILSTGRVGIEDVRDIRLVDLLGRHQIDTDLASICDYLRGRRVLVTGAGGSIGSELCRQIDAFGPAELIMLDRDESALHALELSLRGRALLDGDAIVLADIREADTVRRIFSERRPQVVFHAAALKHLAVLEQYPTEAIKTNVVGTANVLTAARDFAVERFVNISTDKAADPISVLGQTKRIAEGLTADVARTVEGTFLSVRFGNVLGSRGSVLTSFAGQIARGGPITVTDPEVTRYLMTVEEAVQLVVQAGAIGRPGQALVLDMGTPISIDAVARQLVALSGRDIPVTYTGLRRGEKLHEQLFGRGEVDRRPVHPLISHVQVPAYPLDRALDLPLDLAPSSARALLDLEVAQTVHPAAVVET